MKNKNKKNKYIGICTVGEKGQIVIPKPARDMFDIQPGDSIVVLCDKKKGIALVKADFMQGIADKILGQDESQENQEL
ncbi:MAG: AbrB/MazE/SpoVT family DNA-binding domain-containing protein [Oscillospiraceae bacterium]|nr:AbrB/MazE/SpoVT family DNA-binding domain-containing protein [Oscillospiraceae bacterium]